MAREPTGSDHHQGSPATSADLPEGGDGLDLADLPDPAEELPDGSVDPDRPVWDRARMQDATLCHPIRDGRMLLIEKRRGVGAGNLIAPGGKVEPGETRRECAVRETREETGLEVGSLEQVGELEFVFGDDPFALVAVYRTESFAGEPRETDEGIPEWHPLDALPYDRMWVDDRYWLPYLLAGEPFLGRFRFDSDADRLLAGDVEPGVEF